MKRRPLIASLVSSLAAILVLAAGCGERSPTATHLEATGLEAARVGVGRRVEPIRARYQAGRFSRTIGPEGGVLSFRIGRLVIPPGALSATAEITAHVNGKDLAVEFAPHGLTFRPGHEPTLTMHYGADEATELQLLYFDDAGEVIETLSTVRDRSARSVTGRLHHFSAYGLAASL
jgi:hypothetical protein